jgi:hypothetical protein
MAKRPRRIIAGVLIALGAMLMLFAPETLGGLALVALGVAIEIVGIALEKMR